MSRFGRRRASPQGPLVSARNGAVLLMVLAAIAGLTLTFQSASSSAAIINTNGSLLLQQSNEIVGNPAESSIEAAIRTISSSGVSSTKYIPASTEQYIMDHAVQLGYNTADNADVCAPWLDPKTTPIHDDLATWRKELKEYNRLMNQFKPVPDLRLKLDNDPAICKTVELHPDGLSALFPSGQLSLSSSGYIEPLLPPLRHPDMCFDYDYDKNYDPLVKKSLMDLSYLVHDFGAMCRQLKPTSRIILLDMGASLAFHGGANQPAVYLIELFRKFGFPFDHIYAFEVTPTDPATVFEKLPSNIMAAYHWINVGVSADPKSKLNPLKMILENYNEDDLIIVKLDIDTSSIEVPLAIQLLTDSRYHTMIDQFYFEHHVRNKALARDWRQNMKGSFKESLDLFAGLREKGIPAHSWV